MPSTILDTDVMVLQREGLRPFIPENKPPQSGGSYPNLEYDMDIFRFTGLDLRETVKAYNEDSNVFVHRKGDVMTGNLSIELLNTKIPKPAELTLRGKSSGLRPYGSIIFDNGAVSTRDSEQKIDAIHASDGSNTHIRLGKQFAVNSKGRVYLGGRYIFANDGDNGTDTVGGGFLSYGNATYWDPTTGYIKNDQLGSTVRLRWTSYGGALKNSNEKDTLKWTQNGVDLRDGTGNVIVKTDIVDGGVFRYNTTQDLIDPTDITHKHYVDSVAGMYVPLDGTLIDKHITGPLRFDYTSTNAGYLTGAPFSPLFLKQDDVSVMSIGGWDDAQLQLTDTNVHFYQTVTLHNNPLIDVNYPESHTLGIKDTNDTQMSHAAPKEYIDDQDDKLQHQIDSITGIASPVGMINAYVGDTDPVGWFICDGRNVQALATALGRSSLPKLEALVGSELPQLAGAFLAQKKQTVTTRGVAHESTGVVTQVSTSTPIGGDNVGSRLLNHVGASTAQPHTWTITMKPHIHQTAENGGHQHRFGKKNAHGNLAGDKRDDAGGTDYLTSEAGAHNHDISATLTEVASTTWDSYTRPQAFTINWIIKHD